MIEVEIKAPIKDIEALKRRLEELGAQFIAEEDERDVYFNAPHRDFAKKYAWFRRSCNRDKTQTGISTG